jgi:hypothetical protein
MVKYWYIQGDFLTDRSRRIGASDIPALIPNPERPTESLAGYGRTPVTVWQEKTDRKERDPAGFPAEMGHYLEQKSIELFIRHYAGKTIADAHINDRLTYEYTGAAVQNLDAARYQSTPFKHHVQYHRDGMIAHPDALYDADSAFMPLGKKTQLGITVNFDKPFLVEAKSASHWSALRPEGSIVKGYDPKLKTWQGIPLAHYMQIQFQLALFEIDTAYLALIHDTNNYDVWQIAANRSHQGKLIDLAGKMVHRIETDTPPADLAMNAKDIMDLYPVIGDDFAILNGEERDKAVELAREYKDAAAQEKKWEERKKDASDAMAVLLKDRPEIRDGEGTIAKWRVVSGSERVVAASKIKDTDPQAYRYLRRKDLLYKSADSRSVHIGWKGGEE